MQVEWKFYCGLVEIKPCENKFKSILHKTDGNTLFHIQCAYESQQKIVCAQVLKNVQYNILLDDKYLSTPDFAAIGYVTNITVLPTKLTLLNCNINVEAVDALVSEMEKRARCSLQGLHIETEAVGNAQIECIQKLLSNFGSLKHLFIRATKVVREFKSFHPESLGFQFSNLTELTLINVDVTPLLPLRDLAFTNLMTLHFKGDSIGIEVLATGLKH